MGIQEHAGKTGDKCQLWMDIDLHSLCSDVLQVPRQLHWPSLGINKEVVADAESHVSKGNLDGAWMLQH